MSVKSESLPVPIDVSCSCGKQYRLKDELSGKKIRCKGCEKILVVAPTAAIAPPLPSAEKRRRPEAAPQKKRASSAAAVPESAPRRKKKRPQKKRRDTYEDAADPFGGLDDLADDYGDDYSNDDNPYAAPKAKSRKKKKSRGGSSSTLTFSQKLFSFEGRINRGDYWMCNILINVALFLYYGLVIGLFFMFEGNVPAALQIIVSVVSIPVLIAVNWAAWAVVAKRLHDRDRSGWFSLILLIPFVNIWIMIECAFLAGTPGRNDFGAQPS